MKIIQVCPRFYPNIGGIETHVYEICKRLAKNNEVYVYTTDPTKKLPKQEIIDGIKVFRFDSFAPNEAYFFSPEMYFALKKQKCDILHLHSFHSFPSFLAYSAMKPNFKKLIFTPHYHPTASTILRNIMHKLYDPIQAKVFDKSNKIICVSNYEIDLLNKKFGISKEKMINIPNGINKIKKLKNGKKKGIFQILYVGRLEKYKRVQWVLLGLKEILNKFPNKKISLVIVGSGPFEKKLKKLTHDLKLTNFVDYKNTLTHEELIKEYYNCDVFVMPSEYEAFSISTLEALSCGKPIIVSNVGFLSELAKNNGYTIESKEDLVKSLLSIINNGTRFKFNFKKYSWSNVANKIFNVYVE